MLMALPFLLISVVFLSGLVLAPVIVVAVSLTVWGRDRERTPVAEPHSWSPADAQTGS